MRDLINKVASYLPVKNTYGEGGFTVGNLDHETAKEIIILIERSQWVNVKSYLPNKKGMYDIWIYNRREINQWFNGNVFMNPNITHWRPLPLSPDSDKSTIAR